jgi:Xaa-Pro aminopeptidase
MIKENILTKEEKQWIKEHNQRCREKLEPLLKEKDDKRALKWLKREAERGIGCVGPGPYGITVEWD